MTAPLPHPATLAELLPLLRQRATDAARIDPMTTVNPGYSTGYRDGWQDAVAAAEALEGVETADAPPELLRRLAAELGERIRRVHHTTIIQPTTRAGTADALQDAQRIVQQSLDRARAAWRARVVTARPHTEDDLSDWSAYPIVPVEDVDSAHALALFLGGDDTSFTGDLLRLIGKADPPNLNKLAQGFPRHVHAYLMWRASSPVPARTLVALLEATHIPGGG